MTEHFTLRFRSGVSEQLQRHARRSGTPPRTLAQRYIEEGLRRDDHPLIYFADGPSGRRASLAGTGLDVWEVVATARSNENDLAATAEFLDVSSGLIEAAVAYYGEYSDEIDAEVALNEEEWERGYRAFEVGQRALES